ncbi:MAG: hypothetical protein WCF16_10275 [Alphaproteobacteria bacterium]
MRVIAALLAAGFAAAPALATAADDLTAAPPSAEQMAPAAKAAPEAAAPLSQDKAKAFVEAMEEIRPKIDAFHGKQAKGGKPPEEAEVKAQEAELVAIVQKHGFDKESWNSTGDRVVSAYSFAKLENSGKSVEDQIAAAEARVQADTQSPPDQKKHLLQALKETREQYKAAAVDKPAVLPLMERLKKVLEE